MPRVDQVTRRLADEVRADGVAAETVVLQDFPVLLAVVVLAIGAVDFEVIAPDGQFQAVVAELLRLLAHRLDRKVGPLAGEEAYGSCHGSGLLPWGNEWGVSVALLDSAEFDGAAFLRCEHRRLQHALRLIRICEVGQRHDRLLAGGCATVRHFRAGR